MTEYTSETPLPTLTKIYKARKKGKYYDHIFTFDIETTSLFDIEGELKPFDYSLPPDYYRGRDKRALPYIWQAGIDDHYYFCRDFHTFGDFLLRIHDDDTAIIFYVHNLSFETEYLFSIIKARGWHITEMIARGLRKVVTFKIEELNIYFRCSYALTNLSLEKSGKYYNCDSVKLVGDLDYNQARSPKTKLEPQELAYCEADIRVMYEFLGGYFLDKYKHVVSIPLTQTGEVRKEINGELPYYYHVDVWDKIPDVDVYMANQCAFMGGIAHGNHIRSGKIYERVPTKDRASSYPTVLATSNHLPIGHWFTLRPSEEAEFKKVYCLLYHVKLWNIKSRYFNHYLPFSKCVDSYACRCDNGRIMSGTVEIFLTDVDFEIVKRCYKIEQIDIIDLWACRAGRLNTDMVKFILDMYERKTTLKNVPGMEAIYAKAKQCINALFGIACYNPMKQNYVFDLYSDKIWDPGKYTPEFMNEKLAEMKKSYSVLFPYSIGVWTTAHARAALWDAVTGNYGKTPGYDGDRYMDRDVIYYDTDSCKYLYPDKHDYLFEIINKKQHDANVAAAAYHNIPIEKFIPKDPDGVTHELGLFEHEGVYDRFKTLGAKKYAYEEDGEVHITVAGVPKSAAVCLKSLEDFKKGLRFPYQWKDEKGVARGKLAMYYDDEQEPFTFVDKDGEPYECTDIDHAIIAQPTVYELGLTLEYEALIELANSNHYY